ncbi:LuxR C-terminal-related transcriptional regulator [Adlercreutzia sp. ZJ304]|uniref:response regulator transcription factor n=1 Tax=Adlercreutzia sp. ZJ304 TaxID=2709791 RepID=UPI0013EA315D|nr:LuxR C-terminal-related transcriptional regulator [Adlercreutzia sp. ZJ304]
MDNTQRYDSYMLPSTKVQKQPKTAFSLTRNAQISSVVSALKSKSHFVLIQACIGSGKSTLLNQIDETLTRKNLNISWLRLDPYDSSNSLRMYLNSLPAKTILIIDDIHSLSSKSFETCIEPFMNSPMRPALVVTAQTNCQFTQAYANRCSMHLDDSDLFFSKDEIRKLEAKYLKYPRQDISDILFDLFYGWPLPTCMIFRTIANSTHPSKLAHDLANTFIALNNFLLKDSMQTSNYLHPYAASALRSINSIATKVKYGAIPCPIALLTMSSFSTQPLEELISPSSNHTFKTTEVVLSQKELEVLRHASNAMSVKQIASVMFVSEQTVRTHLKNSYHKLNAHSKKEAIEQAIIRNLL